jgi:hypothetical protein
LKEKKAMQNTTERKNGYSRIRAQIVEQVEKSARREDEVMSARGARFIQVP